MPKQLYPKPQEPRRKRAKKEDRPEDHPYHVYYEDPKGELEGEWKHYESEAAVRADSWYQTQVLGFRTRATLYTKEEFLEGALGGGE